MSGQRDALAVPVGQVAAVPADEGPVRGPDERSRARVLVRTTAYESEFVAASESSRRTKDLADRAMRTGRSVVVIGGPGSGRSALLRSIARDARDHFDEVEFLGSASEYADEWFEDRTSDILLIHRIDEAPSVALVHLVEEIEEDHAQDGGLRLLATMSCTMARAPRRCADVLDRVRVVPAYLSPLDRRPADAAELARRYFAALAGDRALPNEIVRAIQDLPLRRGSHTLRGWMSALALSTSGAPTIADLIHALQPDAPNTRKLTVAARALRSADHYRSTRKRRVARLAAIDARQGDPPRER